ncbi:hypothetical protein AYO44_13160 [Planctomycetaceae bacterium SCGC AG-212-F19]|nr:hypothetical protein AYO44_13160 [Planctomycetaceae bacterium SCGC AG-212-F19]
MCTPDLLTLIPDPKEVHRCLGEVLREERLLRRLLRLSLAAQQEVGERDHTVKQEVQSCNPR